MLRSFITYKATPHLDGKHTIFGKLVGGGDILTTLEFLPSDEKDRPKEKIVIEKVKITKDPFESYREKQRRDAEDKINKQQDIERRSLKRKEIEEQGKSSKVGKYL